MRHLTSDTISDRENVVEKHSFLRSSSCWVGLKQRSEKIWGWGATRTGPKGGESPKKCPTDWMMYCNGAPTGAFDDFGKYLAILVILMVLAILVNYLHSRVLNR